MTVSCMWSAKLYLAQGRLISGRGGGGWRRMAVVERVGEMGREVVGRVWVGVGL